MTSSTVSNFTDEELHDICRAIGTKVHIMERGVIRARNKGLQELAHSLEKGLNHWIRLLNKAKEFDHLNQGGFTDDMD